MRAFTLIETIIYIGLFALVMQGALSGILAIEHSNEHDQAMVRVTAESEFLADKLTYELLQAENITEPSNSDPKEDLRYTDSDGIATHVFAAANDVLIVRGTGLEEHMNDSGVVITNLRFARGGTEASSTDPLYIEFSFHIANAGKDAAPYAEDQSHRIYRAL